MFRKIERMWNIFYYVHWKVLCKIHLLSNKISPIMYFYKHNKWAIRHFKKMGINPESELNKVWNNSEWGFSHHFTQAFMYLHIALFSLFTIFLMEKLFDIQLSTFIATLIIIILFWGTNYFLIYRKDKYLKYFKEFDRKSRRWKWKWGWISLGMDIASLIYFIIVVKYINSH